MIYHHILHVPFDYNVNSAFEQRCKNNKRYNVRKVNAINNFVIVFTSIDYFIGIVNEILSFKGWIPLSRLTYCAYLLNPFLIEFFHLYSEVSFHVEFVSMVSIRLSKYSIILQKACS